jgi:hypothetical protein
MPGLISSTRILSSFRSTDLVRANERTAALVAVYAQSRIPVIETIDAFNTNNPLSCNRGSAFCAVNSSQFTLTLNSYQDVLR